VADKLSMSISRSANVRAADVLTPTGSAVAERRLARAAALLVAAGYTVLPPLDRAEHAQLSAREQQVAALLLDGASNKLIARGLDISVHTAKFHVTAVMDKLGARNRADAVAIILREGLISL
jgi:DNA-binding CsgD family transcriptional regulator